MWLMHLHRGNQPTIICGNCSNTFNSFSNIRSLASMALTHRRKSPIKKWLIYCWWTTTSMCLPKKQKIAYAWAERRCTMNRQPMTNITFDSVRLTRKSIGMFWKILRISWITWDRQRRRHHLDCRGWMKVNTSRSANDNEISRNRSWQRSERDYRKEFSKSNKSVYRDRAQRIIEWIVAEFNRNKRPTSHR